jgi:hypothetical protein
MGKAMSNRVNPHNDLCKGQLSVSLTPVKPMTEGFTMLKGCKPCGDLAVRKPGRRFYKTHKPYREGR